MAKYKPINKDSLSNQGGPVMKYSFTRSGFGIISLFMLFFVIIMMILSTLFYQEAIMKQNVSNQYEQHVKEYYAADQTAIIRMQEIQDMQTQDSESLKTFYQEHDIRIIDEHTLAYQVLINDDLALHVTLVIEDDIHIQEWVVKGR